MELKTIKKNTNFIPEFNGNKKLPDTDQIRITIKNFPTALEAKSYKNFKYSGSGDVQLNYNDTYMILNCVGVIRNLIIDKKEIKNGEDLVKSKCLGLDDFITEIRNYVLDDGGILEPGESKA